MKEPPAPCSVIVDSSGRLHIPDLRRIGRAVPNEHRFLGGINDSAVGALDGLRSRQIPTAFLNARRCIWEARLSGHVYDERWALRLLADIVRESNRPVNEVVLRVAAGDAKGAAEAAATLTDWVDVRDQLYHGTPWEMAAAAATMSAQADLVSDDAVDPVVTRLLELAQTAATAPSVAGQPSLEAFYALSAFAFRASASNLDPLIAFIRPHLEARARLINHAAPILRGLYLRHPSRRGELAELLIKAIAQPYADEAWAVAEALREREPGDAIEAAARRLAAGGNDYAINALATWRVNTSEVRRAARHAAEHMLRMPVGHPRNSWSFGFNTTLAAHKVATLVAHSDDSDRAIDPTDGPGATVEDAITHVDAVASLAAGPTRPLAIAFVEHLLAMAEDRYDIAAARAEAVRAIAIMIDTMSTGIAMTIARRLLVLANDPRFGPQDDAELKADDPFQFMRANIGGRSLASQALRTAVRAYRHAVTSDPTQVDQQLAANLLRCGENLLRTEHDDTVTIAASALAIVAGHANLDLYRLVSHPLATARAAAIHAWINTPGAAPGIPELLATDPAIEVRKSLAPVAGKIQARLGHGADEILTHLRHDRSFTVRYHTALALERQTAGGA